MIIKALAFYMFSGIAVSSGMLVIAARNPVHSVMYLILTFFNAAGLFILMGAEFLAMILVVVYVGAVAVLFLFVVMMLDVEVTALRQNFLQYLPTGGLVALILVMELVFVIGSMTFEPKNLVNKVPSGLENLTNAEAIGNILYTDYIYLFQASGLVLLVAMIGAIVLTMRVRSGVRKQHVGDQIARRPRQTVQVRKIPPGEGV